jgi:hypothetical protein
MSKASHAAVMIGNELDCDARAAMEKWTSGLD